MDTVNIQKYIKWKVNVIVFVQIFITTLIILFKRHLSTFYMEQETYAFAHEVGILNIIHYLHSAASVNMSRRVQCIKRRKVYSKIICFQIILYGIPLKIVFTRSRKTTHANIPRSYIIIYLYTYLLTLNS